MLAIITNTDERPTICALCHQLTPRPAGPVLVLQENGEAVCEPCGRQEEPELAGLLLLEKAARGYAGELLAVLGE